MPAVAADRFLSSDPDAPRLANGITTLLHHPQLAAKFLSFNGQLLWEPVLSPRLRELIVLRVARRTRSQYEWVQHAKLSQRYDVTTEEVEAIALDDDAVFSELEADVLRATDQLLETQRVEDNTWQRLADAFDEKTRLELLFVVGTYTALAMVFNGVGVELDPDLDPAAFPALPED
ncbi:MAG TPA: carboxymuconolactone decarboxylase family protein [Mycobacteriales bacterium]|jgi:alkylhydroperoxidase family enzyme|nr:carboxymuconolactone decarboxylase family protein [Mycobacteriales bacterium]